MMAGNHIVSQRGKPKFVSNGYIYLFDELSADKVTKFYRCERRDCCKARIHVRNEEVIRCINEHSHEAAPAKIEKDIVISRIKEQSAKTVEGTSRVVNECIENLSQACQGAMPNHKALKKMIRRIRKDTASYPDNPSDLADIRIPETFKKYICNGGETEDFLLGDSGCYDTSSRILIFGRRSNVRLLVDSEKFFVDGTFRIAPPLFSQVLYMSFLVINLKE